MKLIRTTRGAHNIAQASAGMAFGSNVLKSAKAFSGSGLCWSVKDSVGNLDERRRMITVVRQPRVERFVREPQGVRFVCSSSFRTVELAARATILDVWDVLVPALTLPCRPCGCRIIGTHRVAAVTAPRREIDKGLMC